MQIVRTMGMVRTMQMVMMQMVRMKQLVETFTVSAHLAMYIDG
jgi:hypothetical protein